MSKVRVIVLEDHPFQRAVLEHNLASLANIEVFAFGSAQDALTWLDVHNSADIVICDLMMAGTDGLSFLRKAKAKYDIASVALFSCIDKELRRAVSQMIKMLNFEYLGDLSKSPSVDNLQSMLDKFVYSRAQKRKVISTPRVEIRPKDFTLADFQLALDQHQFVGFYQPKFNVANFNLAGVEVLARWIHPELGTLNPAAFIEPLITYGLLDELFLQLFEQGCQLQQELLEQEQQISLAYNLDISQLNSTKLVYRIVDIVKRFNIHPRSITLEITETGLLSAPAVNMENLIRLRMQGFELAIDDFGAAHSSLARLCELPFSQIKLDSCFVRELGVEPRCQAAISSVIALSQALNMELVIEGIETNSQLVLLQQLGCTIGQGFCFSRPIDEQTFIQRFFPASSQQREPQ
ncbi:MULTISPECIES: EAL domain-containing response regulator [Shewanella]|uniref:EAL domain-containing response regulator n=1 Tax=Shewanella putrefaciens TaxID=24 RepID=A0ABX8XB94_SHEPU|nr:MULTISPECIES: EAL domain-containing response regulator [Shewanella]ABM26706.1 response regulator receiver modulated diguanylate phosphodiesterase [Shewanella sp. W3-18-1]AVV84732.1 diguanylate phosphodiesterase [Shewanella putrefaciens]MCT8944005.1 EAL domain-containing response regulator [Shewanella putrefaciens]QSE49295.1 EAL domain-containing response regulator [Shewanella putrefaciens]QYX72703.1 EAL domain-containing response regulator [Shewanella putrefaciens]